MATDSLSRRSFLRASGRSLAALSLAGCSATGRGRGGRPPNILLALADDWGWPHAGAYGDRTVRTPSFDRIAGEGVLFDHAYVPCPSCTPCRNSLLTGQAFYRLGQGANLWSTLDARLPTFVSLLRGGGYQVGHWRKAWGPGDFRAGGYREHPCGPRVGLARFLETRKREQPFCFWFGTSDPHRPYRRGSGRKSGLDPATVRLPRYHPDRPQIRDDYLDYYAEVERWDRDVGRALQLLAAAGELDNTVVVMSGDHGMPFPRCKGNLYDGGTRVPLAVRWGGVAAPGRRVGALASLTDLAPTFLDLAGVAVPEVMTGRSLRPLLVGGEEDRRGWDRGFIVTGRERHTPAQAMPAMDGYPSRALRTERWLLILNLEPNRWPAGVPAGATHPAGVYADCDNGPTKAFLLAHRRDPAVARAFDLCFARRPAVELYDCRSDPDQVDNLAGDRRYAEVTARLKRQLTDHLACTGDPRFTGGPVRFDRYPYEAGYMKRRLERYRQGRAGTG